MKRSLFLAVLLILSVGLSGQNFRFSGQLDTWATTKPFDKFDTQLGGRYIPELSYKKIFADTSKIDFEASGNIYGRLDYLEVGNERNGNIKPYRVWARYSTDQFEFRVGLQKINFGSAQILRPLMWFDKMDPRDPLQITDGVYGVLGRYYFNNNTNIWLWGLVFNDELKGWEPYNSKKDRPEFGGRIQVPLLNGEFAISYHNRFVEYIDFTSSIIPVQLNFTENRLGFDGKWDAIVGFYVEGSIHHYNLELMYTPWTKMFNFGLDYSFAVGEGLSATHELLWLSTSQKLFKSDVNIFFSALMVNYTIGFMDNISAMVYYNYSNKDWYRILSYQRTYDKLSIYVMAFWNPELFQLYQNMEGSAIMSGKGVQLRLVYNH